MPVVWFDDEARVVPDVRSQLSLLIVSLNVASYLKFILPSISLLVILITSVYILGQVRATVRLFELSSEPFVLVATSEPRTSEF